MDVEIAIEPLTGDHKSRLAGFDCGDEGKNRYVKQFARQNDERGVSRTYVAVVRSGADAGRVVGFYTVHTSHVFFEDLPDSRHLPRYPVPTVLIGKLATDKRWHGRGIGTHMVIDAMRRALRAAQELGVYAIEVMALNDRARSLYLRLGFTQLLDDERHLFLPLKVILKSGLAQP